MSNKSKKQKYSRSYSQRTLKILFAMSRNECAEPSCANPVILPKTDFDEEAVSAQISHIYAVSDDGPRGKTGLTQEDRNHHNNLLLLCPTHHVTVDQQHNTYPASMLLKWKDEHERSLPSPLIDRLVSQFGSAKPKFSDQEKMSFLSSKAIEYHEMRKRLAELTATDEKLSRVVSQITAAIDQGDFTRADILLQKAEEFQYAFVTKEAIKRQTDFRLERGNASLLSGNLGDAIEHYEKAAGYFSGISKVDEAKTRHTYIQHLRYYAYRYRDYLSLYAAKDALTKNLKIWSRPRDLENWCKTMNALGGVLVRLSEFDGSTKRREHLNSAKDCYEDVRHMCSENADTVAYATASLDLANVYSAHDFCDTKDEFKDNLQFAIELQLNALDYFKEATQPRAWGIVQHNLGCSFTSLSNLSATMIESQNYLRKAIEHAELSFRVRTSENELQYWVASCRTAGEAYISLSQVSSDQESKKLVCHAKEILIDAQTKINREDHPNQWEEIEKQLLRLHA